MFALYTRRENLWSAVVKSLNTTSNSRGAFNYSFLLYEIRNIIVWIAVVVALPSCLLKVPIAEGETGLKTLFVSVCGNLQHIWQNISRIFIVSCLWCKMSPILVILIFVWRLETSTDWERYDKQTKHKIFIIFCFLTWAIWCKISPILVILIFVWRLAWDVYRDWERYDKT
jgi:hypothetical protein